MPWPRAKTAPRSVGRVISPPNRHCQRLVSTNRRIVRLIFRPPRCLDFCGLRAVLEPQSCDVLAYNVGIESSEIQLWGLPARDRSQGSTILFLSPSPVPEGREASRDLREALSFASSAGPWALDSRTTMRRAPVPCPTLHRGTRALDEQRSPRVSFSVEFGGTLA